MNTPFTLKKTLATFVLAMSLPVASAALASNALAEASGVKAPNAHCERGPKHDMHGANMHKPGMPPYLRAVNLTEAQKDQLFALRHEQAPKMREQHKAQFKLMQEMRETTQADQFDEAKAKSIASQMAALDQEKILARAQNEAKIFALLTPEQRTKAREFKMHKNWGPDHGPRGEHVNFKGHRHLNPAVKS